MEAIFFAIISYFGWGIGVLLEAVAARKLRPYSLIFWSYVFTVVLLGLYAPFRLGDLKNLTVELLGLILILSFIAFFMGIIFYYEALRIGNRALVGTIASSFPIVAVILSIIFLGERVNTQQAVAIVIIVTGLILSSLNFNALKSESIFNKASLLALLTMLAWGIYFAFIKIPVSKVGWFWPTYIYFFTFPLVFLFLKVKKLKLEMPTKNNALKVIIVSVILVRIAELSYNYAITKGLVTVVAPIAGANPTLFVVLAFLFFKDPITKQQMLGIVTTLIGIVLLSIFSV